MDAANIAQSMTTTKMMVARALRIWVGNYGNYPIPQHLQAIRLTKSGWPDKRCKLYDEFMNWAKDK
jgi:hypothetical protein